MAESDFFPAGRGGGGAGCWVAQIITHVQPSHRFAGVVEAVRVIASGSAQFPKRNHQHGISSLLNVKPCSCNLTCCLPAPLIMTDVLALSTGIRPVVEGPRADVTKSTGHSIHKYAAVAVGQHFTRTSFAGGITADGGASLVLAYPIAFRKETAHQQQCADPIWGRIYSIWNPPKPQSADSPS